VAEWFPKKERALATGIFNAGTNIGAIVTPLVVPTVVLAFGWQTAFIVTGLAGLIWLPLWLLISKYVGGVLETIGTYTPIFIVAGSGYLLARLVVHLLSPRLEPVKLTSCGGDPGSSRLDNVVH
jgi:MFS family permease